MPTSQSLIFSTCSLFMGILFAYSASVQLNDPDWYFWLPLYALASAVNLHISFTSKSISQMILLVLWGGILMLLKVLVEGHVNGLCGFWSMDLGERIVREKIGSGLVVISMSLHLRATAISKQSRGRIQQSARFLVIGVAMLVALSFGLSVYFFAFVKENMKL